MKSNGTVIKYNGTLTLVQSIYDYVHLALWATLAAFVVFFLADSAIRNPQIAKEKKLLMTGKSRRMGSAPPRERNRGVVVRGERRRLANFTEGRPRIPRLAEIRRMPLFCPDGKRRRPLV